MITEIAEDISGRLPRQPLKNRVPFSILIHNQLYSFREDTMFTAFDAAEHLLIGTNAEVADVQLIGVGGQVKGRLAGFGWVYVIAVAGDAAELDSLEGLV